MAFAMDVPPVPVVPVTTECVVRAAQRFSVYPNVLFILKSLENGEVGKVSRKNKNGTYDIGPWQINSSWLKVFKPFGISEDDLKFNGCLNASVAAWIVRYEMNRAKSEDILVGVARFHHPNNKNAQETYVAKFLKELVKTGAAAPEKLVKVASVEVF